MRRCFDCALAQRYHKNVFLSVFCILSVKANPRGGHLLSPNDAVSVASEPSDFSGGVLMVPLSVSLPQPTALPQQSFSMHVAVPVSNPNAMYQPGGALGSQALAAAAATASLSDSGMLSPPHASLHRNLGSAGASQRPTSAGSAGQSTPVCMEGRPELKIHHISHTWFFQRHEFSVVCAACLHQLVWCHPRGTED